jgi:hypothetical protein
VVDAEGGDEAEEECEKVEEWRLPEEATGVDAVEERVDEDEDEDEECAEGKRVCEVE